MARILLVAVLIIALFPYSLDRVVEKGYDFPIYYRAGQGQIGTDYNTGAYVYSHRTAAVFWPLAQLPFSVAFAVFYLATGLAILTLFAALARAVPRYPVLATCAAILAGGAGFVILRCGNIAGLLALACTTPLGSVVAGCFKPHLFAFSVVHAAGLCTRYSGGQTGKVPVGQGQRHLLRDILGCDLALRQV